MVESKCSTNIGYNAHFAYFDFKTQKHHLFLFIFFFMETNKMFIVSNNFVNVKHMYEMWFGIDICWYVSKTKFNHFMHDVYLITHNHLIFFIIHHTFNQNSNFKIYMVPKLNLNIKFKLSSRWFKYVNIQILRW
jgi:hypothetical protein